MLNKFEKILVPVELNINLSEPAKELKKLYQSLYEENERRILKASVKSSKNLLQYSNNFREEFNFNELLKEKFLNKKEFISAIEGNNILLFGNYRTLKDSIFVFSDLIRELHQKNRKISVFTELLHYEKQEPLEAFLAGELEIAAFFEEVDFEEQYPYQSQKTLGTFFYLMKELKIKVFGIDSYPEFGKPQDEDKKTAEIFEESFEPEESELVLFFIAQNHLAQKNLVSKLEKVLKKKASQYKILVVSQNIPSTYWQLLDFKLNSNFNIIRWAPNKFEFSYMPPTVVQNTFMNWQTFCDESLDIFNLKEEFQQLCARLIETFDLNIKKEELLSINLLSPANLYEIVQLKESLIPEEIAFVINQIGNGESFYLPSKNTVYINNLSVAGAAEEASHLIKAKSDKYLIKREPSDLFYFGVINEMIGFFGSKLLFEKRSAPDFDYYYEILEKENDDHQVTEVDFEIAAFIVNYFKEGVIDEISNEIIMEFSKDLFTGIVHGMGYLLGNILFENYNRGIVDKKFIKTLYETPIKKSQAFQQFVAILKKLEQ